MFVLNVTKRIVLHLSHSYTRIITNSNYIYVILPVRGEMLLITLYRRLPASWYKSYIQLGTLTFVLFSDVRISNIIFSESPMPPTAAPQLYGTSSAMITYTHMVNMHIYICITYTAGRPNVLTNLPRIKPCDTSKEPNATGATLVHIPQVGGQKKTITCWGPNMSFCVSVSQVVNLFLPLRPGAAHPRRRRTDN